jgi:hypothetical protein
MRNIILSAGVAMLLVQTAAIAGWSQTPAERAGDASQVAADFDIRVQRYVDLHRTLEGTVPTVTVSNDYATVVAATDALAVKIQAARATARRGEIFTPEIERWFRQMVARSLEYCETAEILRSLNEENPPNLVIAPQVNGRWPRGASFGPVPPQVLAALLALPDELQYRFLHRDLVLCDVHADVIVDFIRKALP